MFVVCGEALMDVFAAGETHTGMTLDARVGGSPFNVAIGLARLGQPVAFLGAVSSGFLGQRLLKALQADGVDTGPTLRVDAPTTLSVVGMDAAGVPSYAFYGADGAELQLSAQALRQVPGAVQAIHVGSYTMVAEPVAAAQRALIEQTRARCVVAYDVNVRLNVEPDLQRWRAALAWMLPRAHVLKLSDEDLGLLFGPQQPAALAAQWLAAGVSLVVLTCGASGAQAWARDGVHAQIAGHAVDVVDTVGAGDTFQAALLTWIAEHGRLAPQAVGRWTCSDLSAALEFAARAAAITCTRRGADLPRRADLP